MLTGLHKAYGLVGRMRERGGKEEGMVGEEGGGARAAVSVRAAVALTVDLAQHGGALAGQQELVGVGEGGEGSGRVHRQQRLRDVVRLTPGDCHQVT
jgi:hypothetical protein